MDPLIVTAKTELGQPVDVAVDGHVVKFTAPSTPGNVQITLTDPTTGLSETRTIRVVDRKTDDHESHKFEES